MSHLPEFDITAVDLRFLTEVARLREAGGFDSYRELAGQLGVQASQFSGIEQGQYHCNVRLLYLLSAHYPQADINWVLFGAARTGRPEPTGFPVRERGRPVSVKSA